MPYALCPEVPGLHYARALILIQLGRKPEALTALKKELANNPQHSHSIELKEKLSAVLDT